MMYAPATLRTSRQSLRHVIAVRSLCSDAASKKNSQVTAAAAAAKADGGDNKTSTGGRGPISWKSFAVFAGVGTGLLAYYAREKERRMQEVMKPRSVGRASIGGPFELIDGDGKLVTEADLLGKWALIYFGFTQCPDICPAELSKVGEALNTLESHGVVVSRDAKNAVSPVFISVDPERDSPQQAAEYAQCFHEAFRGLSGSVEQVKRTAKAFRVYYSKDDENAKEYLVDHSIITYLMDPSGEFCEFYGKNATASEMAARIEAKILAWRKNAPRARAESS